VVIFYPSHTYEWTQIIKYREINYIPNVIKYVWQIIKYQEIDYIPNVNKYVWQIIKYQEIDYIPLRVTCK